MTKEGNPDYYWDNDFVAEVDGGGGEVVEHVNVEMPAACFGNAQLDNPQIITALQAGVIGVDNDTEPAEENVPVPNINADKCIFDNWGHSGICFRRMVGAQNRQAKLNNNPSHLKLSKLQLFETLFPTKWLKIVVLVETNKNLQTRLSYGELLQFIGMWFHIATTAGF